MDSGSREEAGKERRGRGREWVMRRKFWERARIYLP